MVEYIEGTKREQIHLFRESIDELVAPEHFVRFIDAYVESLDMKALGFKMPERKTGSNPYRPQLQLKIYLYGYLERIRSSRRLERECRRNTELLWLTENLAPDFKTLADFRKSNAEALAKLFCAFLQFSARLGLVKFRELAADSTKIRAQNGTDEVYRRATIDKIAEAVKAKVEEYLAQLEKSDKAEEHSGLEVDEERMKALAARLHALQKREKKIQEIQKLFKEDKDLTEYYGTDPDSRNQSDKGKIRPGYNVQTVVDGEQNLIVSAEVDHSQSDQSQASKVVERIREQKKTLGVEAESTVVMDSGYYSEKEILAVAGGTSEEVFISIPEPKSGSGKSVPGPGFEQKDFSYEESGDVFHCPAGAALVRVTTKPQTDHNGREVHHYRAGAAVCAACPLRAQCTTSPLGRMLKVSAHRAEMKAFGEKMKSEEGRGKLTRRKAIVEHPFGTIKRALGYDHFLLRGLAKVRGELSMICTVYNMKRVINMFSVSELVKMIG